MLFLLSILHSKKFLFQGFAMTLKNQKDMKQDLLTTTLMLGLAQVSNKKDEGCITWIQVLRGTCGGCDVNPYVWEVVLSYVSCQYCYLVSILSVLLGLIMAKGEKADK